MKPVIPGWGTRVFPFIIFCVSDHNHCTGIAPVKLLSSVSISQYVYFKQSCALWGIIHFYFPQRNLKWAATKYKSFKGHCGKGDQSSSTTGAAVPRPSHINESQPFKSMRVVAPEACCCLEASQKQQKDQRYKPILPLDHTALKLAGRLSR